MKKYSFWVILPLLLFTEISAQPLFSMQERLQGYSYSGEEAYFVFDEIIYNVQPEVVIVEGSFRGWDHNLHDAKWQLQKDSENSLLWILRAPVPISVQAEFKFRINDGIWMAVPNQAPNRRGDNLIFAHNFNPPQLEAELVSNRFVRALISGQDVEVSLDPSSYRLTEFDGSEVPILKIFYIAPGQVQIYPVMDLDLKRVYYLEELKIGLKTVVSFDGWFRHIYSDKVLGANYDKMSDKTWFRIFAPRATALKLYLYKKPDADHYARYDLKMDTNGVWELALKGDLNGIYYDYTAHGYKQPGNHFFETNPVHITDPYAQNSLDSFGPSRVWTRVDPPDPVAGGRPPMEDIIAYEVHIQDFTDLLPVEDSKKGTFTGFTVKGLRNSRGEKIGFDHLVELGINVVHLQPVQEFLHYPLEAWKETFSDDPYMKEQGINEQNYQWGYRTTHFMAIESRYREKGTEWGAQNQQFRDLVQAFHEAGILVVVDVVFNHTGERMDGRMDYFNFSVLDKIYYYRTNESLDYIGEYGTEVKSEERPMTQRWIIDQCKNLVEQYGVDGFRIDLAGQTDEQTLKELRRELGPEIIIYGEPWIASADPAYEDNPDWDWYKNDAPITFFQDEARNAFKGPPSNPANKWHDRGYAGGNGDRESVKKALSAGFADDDTPLDGINYLDIHDNWALADRFAITNWDGRYGVEENRVKIAATLLLTSLGPVVLHGGTEFLRSKGHAPLQEIEKEFQGKTIFLHGKRDTYNLATANHFLWENKGKSRGDDNGKIKCNYDNMYKYWRNLIALRNSDIGKIFRIGEKPPESYYQWYEPENPKALGYLVAENLLVLINTDTVNVVFNEIGLPEASRWQLIADIDQINIEEGINIYNNSQIVGSKSKNILLEKESLKIWVRQE